LRLNGLVAPDGSRSSTAPLSVLCQAGPRRWTRERGTSSSGTGVRALIDAIGAKVLYLLTYDFTPIENGFQAQSLPQKAAERTIDGV
jgi:hypothetical protein